ncbi:MAG: hypothetical protein K2M12_03820 [Muribaculaceae bacterium]|nr:hypothetical protein [Muribaculaceae bacterium]
MKSDWICIAGAALGLLTGVGRGIGGLTLLSGNQTEMIVGIGLISVALLLVATSVALFAKQNLKRKQWLSAGIILFWIDGIVNGFVLFGAPQLSGQIINLVIVALVLTCLWYRKNGTKERY